MGRAQATSRGTQRSLAGCKLIDIEARDADTPLSELGQQQSQVLARWFAEQDEAHRPDVFLDIAVHPRARNYAGDCVGGRAAVRRDSS